MDINIETNDMRNDDQAYIADYNRFLKEVRNTRRENISVADLCSKLNAQKTTIYRIERAEVDPKLSTLMFYLHGFDYHLEIVPDKKAEPAPDTLTPDLILDVNGTDVLIEQFDLNKAKTDKSLRIKAVQFLLSLIEEDLKIDKT